MNIDSVDELFGEDVSSKSRNKSLHEKHVDVVEYLKSFSREKRITPIDIQRDLGYDLNFDILLLDMIKNNPKIDLEHNHSNTISMQYRAKYEVKNKAELLVLIDRIRSGVLMSDIIDCYPEIGNHCMEMILSGEVIACRNSEKKTIVLYPRGNPFYAALSGTLTARPGSHIVSTADDLTSEIRRGDAILVGQSWYRVSSATKPPTAGGNGQSRSKAHSSVTSDKELSARNNYHDPFNSNTLPLDGDYDGSEVFTGKGYKHGCTNDVRDMWNNTAASLKQDVTTEERLFEELTRLNLLSKRTHGPGLYRKRGSNQRLKVNEKKQRKQRQVNSASQHNVHLIGSNLDRMIEERNENLL